MLAAEAEGRKRGCTAIWLDTFEFQARPFYEKIGFAVFGTLDYEGSGVFLAAGTGITPFIAIFRDLHRHNKIPGNKLIYVNKTVEDVIMGNELFKMLKRNFVNVLTRENTIGYVGKRIDRNFLIENINDFSQHFYVCGPDSFVKDMTKYLLDLGADVDSLVVEK